MRIDNLSTLKQYISNLSEMSNSTKQNLNQLTINSLSISDLLQNLSLKSTDLNKLIAQELLKADLPLNKKLIAELNQFLTNNNLGGSQETKIQTAILLKQLKLPLNNKFFKLFANYAQNPKSLPDNLKQLLTKHLQPLNTQQTNQSINQPAKLNSPQLLKQLKLTPQTTQQLNINSNQPPLTLLKNLISALTNDNSQLPNRQTILNQLKTIFNNQPQLLNNLKQNLSSKQLTKFLAAAKLDQTINLDSKTKITTPQLLKQLNLSSELTKQLNITSDSKPQQVLNKLVTQLASSQPDSSLLNKIKNLLQNQPRLLLKLQEQVSPGKMSKLMENIKFSPPETKQLATENLKQLLAETMITPNNISPEQIKASLGRLNPNSSQDQLMKLLFNITSANFSEENKQLSAEPQKLLYQLASLKAVNTENDILQLFFPILMKENLQLAQLKIHKDEQQNEDSNQQMLQFSFAVETDKLGTLEVKVKIYDQQINTLFITDNQQTQNLIEQYGAKFKEKFADLDYNLNYFNCKLSEEELTTADKQEIKLNSIDFTI